MKQPQEIEVWYLIPAIRRELTKIMVKEEKLSQKNVAKLLNITEAAISQYLKEKRAKDICFDSKSKKILRNSANSIIKNPSSLMDEMVKISESIEYKKILCKVHRKYDNQVPKICKVCLK